jgi:CPA2 family monovalent cation:H+ antiporter-2
MHVLVGQNFLEDLALVLCVAAAATVLFQSLRQPLVVGYLAAGMVVGPYVPLPIYANPERIREISELGVILLIFSIGLEFRFRRLLNLAPTAGLLTLVQVATMMVLGYAAGRAMGWTPMESLFTAAIVSISSTTIVAKAFEEQSIDSRVRELSLGILLAEDLVAIILLAVLSTAAGGEQLTLLSFSLTGVRLVAFLTALAAVGYLIVPYAVAAVARMGRSETLLITAVGICFAFAMIAAQAGYSVALGAFLAGSLVAESGYGTRVEHEIGPVRDIFGAIFFVSVGMLIQPNLLLEHWRAVALITAVVIAGKIIGVSGAAIGIGERPTVAIRTGFALAQIGEFSFIIAEVARSSGAGGDFLYSMAVAVSTITAFLTPFMIRVSEPAAQLIERAVPAPLAAAMAQYVGWTARLRGNPQIDEQ